MDYNDEFQSNNTELQRILEEAEKLPLVEDGATFYPSVSEDGIISWTNDKGLDVPDPVNIKGKDGDCTAVPVQQLPAASEDTRGKLIILSKENGDIPYICLKTNGIYVWAKFNTTVSALGAALLGEMVLGG